MSDASANNKRIAKNTLLLYIRTIFTMLISLYTSRVILDALGVEDYGIYNVVGGVVAMFSMISGSLSSSISRFLTFEIGRGDREKLKRIFSTSIYIQIALAVIVFVVVEVLAIWFLETQMQIPTGRMDAAHWVLQCTLMAFCINLISIPYNACLIAHEHMKTFAYVSIMEAVLKLGICYLVNILPTDKLVTYAILLTLLAGLIRFVYGVYCHRYFEETCGKAIFDKQLFKEMASFSGWSFFTSTNHMLNTQGINMLMNVYFGVVVNAARGVATQVESAVLQFVNNFTTAINPQITKSYAAGNIEQTYDLVCRGAKFSYLAMLVFSLPLICEAEMILNIWLKNVPDYAVVFTQLSLILGAIDSLGASSYTAAMASGRIKIYSLIITPLGSFVFPLTWLFFAFGASVVCTYYLYILVKLAVLISRFFLLREFIGMKLLTAYQRVVRPIIATTTVASIPPVIVLYAMGEGMPRFFLSVFVGLLSTCAASFFIGMTKGEQKVIIAKSSSLLARFKTHK